MPTTFKTLIEKLTGQPIPFPDRLSDIESLTKGAINLGYSQFNEILLYLGYDRVNRSFFQFLADGTLEYNQSSTITDLTNLSEKINKMAEYFLILFGNIKYGYKQFSSESNEDEFETWPRNLEPLDENEYKKRHSPLFNIEIIKNDNTYYLGYLIQNEIKQRLNAEPDNQEYLQQKAKMHQILEIGIKNQTAYLASDHMDVYVATSMRQKHEYLFVSRVTKDIFSHSALSALNVRYFDPTQAYCSDRIV